MAAQKMMSGKRPAEPPRADVAVAGNEIAAQQRLTIMQRVRAAAEREIEAAERIVQAIRPNDQIEAEQGARTLARVARTLREIMAVTEPDEATPRDETDDDAIPRDIDDIRDALARRLRALIGAHPGSEGSSGRRRRSQS